MPRAWRLRTRPEGEIKDTDLEMCDEPKPAAEEGQLVVKNMYIRCGPSLFVFLLDLESMCILTLKPGSVDPTHRVWMSDKAQYMPKVELGEVMRAATVGVVEESKSPGFPVGCHVVGFGG